MRRQEKYKNTDCFHFYNANPRGRYTTDCVTRAIALATGIPYKKVVMEMAEMQCKTGYDTCEARLYGRYLESKGWVKKPQPRTSENRKYTGKGFCRWLSTQGLGKSRQRLESVIANIGGHHIVAIMPIPEGVKVNYKVCDIWDSTKGCIGNYWVKG